MHVANIVCGTIKKGTAHVAIVHIGSTAYLNYNMHRSKVSTPYETYPGYQVIWNISDLDLAVKKVSK